MKLIVESEDIVCCVGDVYGQMKVMLCKKMSKVDVRC
jgi:hypothetical protein